MNPPDFLPPSLEATGLYSDHMLAELLALHEEMVLQLRLERLEAASSVDFLTCLIDQHAQTATMLRAQIANHEGEVADHPNGAANATIREFPAARFDPATGIAFAAGQTLAV